MDKPTPSTSVRHNDAFSESIIDSYKKWMDGDTFQQSTVEEEKIETPIGSYEKPSFDTGTIPTIKKQKEDDVSTKDPKSNTALSPVSSSNLDVGKLTAATVTLDSTDLASNLAALAAGIVTAATSGIQKAFPSGADLNFGTLTAANTTSTDAFGIIQNDLTTFDCLTEPTATLATEDLGALS